MECSGGKKAESDKLAVADRRLCSPASQRSTKLDLILAVEE